MNTHPHGLFFLLIVVVTAASIGAAPVAGQCDSSQLGHLLATDAAPDAHFGCALALDADTLVIGAYADDTGGGVDSGAAYVFVRSGGVWTQQAKLVASDAAEADHFGWSVAVAGDTAVVGAYLDDHLSGVDAGSAYVFVRSGNTWTQQAKLTASDGAAGDRMGLSVAISAETIIVGAYLDDLLATDAGSAYVFVRSGDAWSQQIRLTAPDPVGNDLFGISVAIDADTALIGAYNNGGGNSGSAYVFVRSGLGTWTFQAKLRASDAADGDQLGIAVAMHGHTAVVGAYADDHDGGTDAGSAYVFARIGELWSQEAKLTASDAASLDSYGHSVAISGDIVAVGAYFDDHTGRVDAGSAYVYARSGSAWVQQANLIFPDADSYDFAGASVALHGSTVLVGADGDDLDAGVDAGSVCAFLVSASACDTNCDGSINGFDVDAFVAVLSGVGAPCSPCAGDVNADGSVNGFDIDGLVDALTGGACVP